MKKINFTAENKKIGNKLKSGTVESASQLGWKNLKNLNFKIKLKNHNKVILVFTTLQMILCLNTILMSFKLRKIFFFQFQPRA